MIFYGVTLLRRPEREVWLMPVGALLDQWEVYKQIKGMTFIKGERHIEDVFPNGL
jgi:hypothetical protein